jgi:threonine dehydratase
MAGCATTAAALSPGIRIIGVEPTDGDDTKRSLETGHRVRIPVPRTIADAQAAETPGELTFAVNRELVDEICLVTDDQLVTAMSFLFDTMKIVAEPTGAAGIAALLSSQVQLPGARIGVIVSGGNISAARFAELVATASSP